MNYRLIQHFANKYPPEFREDLFQEGCVAVLSGKDIRCHMIDRLRAWTKGRGSRRHPEKVYLHSAVAVDDLRWKFDPCEAIYLKEMLPRLRESLLCLKPRWRRVLHLRYWEETKLREIGEELKVTESAVSILHRKAIARLRRMLD